MSNVIAIKNTFSLEEKLNRELADTGFTIEEVLSDDRRINWLEEKSHPNFPGQRLQGDALVWIPSFPIPTLPHQELNQYRQKLSEMIRPLSQTKNIESNRDFFENCILLLINCYPTYCKKDKQFKEDTAVAFLTFLEEFPLAFITSVIHEWIKTEKEFPLIADLNWRLKAKMSDVRKKMKNLEKLIKKSST